LIAELCLLDDVVVCWLSAIAGAIAKTGLDFENSYHVGNKTFWGGGMKSFR